MSVSPSYRSLEEGRHVPVLWEADRATGSRLPTLEITPSRTL